MQYVDINTFDGKTMRGLYTPAQIENARNAPGIVLIQEIFGINDTMQELSRIWSAKGFNVLCPDLFFRQEPNLTLDPSKPEEFEKGVQLMQGMDLEHTLNDLESTRAHLATLIGHENIGSIGYCLGGRLVIQLGAQGLIKAAISYYGVNLEKVLPQVPNTAAPAFLHIAALDKYVAEPKCTQIVDNVSKRPDWGYAIYENCDHAFARPNSPHYVAEAAQQAEQRSEEFLRKHLK
ncbi:MAG TPA: dienelactone hydrolase family protein [Paenalcaligenes sp.]|nr:dienelactone hydrolase family protein [Paenalcaligenes sp.]